MKNSKIRKFEISKFRSLVFLFFNKKSRIFEKRCLPGHYHEIIGIQHFRLFFFSLNKTTYKFTGNFSSGTQSYKTYS